MRSYIHLRLDYCNGFLAGQPDYVYKRLQSFFRSAARLVLLLPCHASVTSLMRDKLHWLGFPYRIYFKLCLLAHKSLHGQAPQYLARHCIPVNTVIGTAHCSLHSNKNVWYSRFLFFMPIGVEQTSVRT